MSITHFTSIGSPFLPRLYSEVINRCNYPSILKELIFPNNRSYEQVIDKLSTGYRQVIDIEFFGNNSKRMLKKLAYFFEIGKKSWGLFLISKYICRMECRKNFEIVFFYDISAYLCNSHRFIYKRNKCGCSQCDD